MKHLLALLILVFVPLAQALEEPGLAIDAAAYRQSILAVHGPGGETGPSSETSPTLQALNRAERYVRQKLWSEAIADYERIIAGGEDGTAVWIALSEAWEANKTHRLARERALQSAYNAYRAARSPTGQARSLFVVGRLLEDRRQPKRAMAAYKEGLGLEESPEYARRYQKLVEVTAFRVKSVEVESESAIPQICLRFSAPLNEGREVRFEDYLLVQPTVKAVVRARGERLCIEGVTHGENYDVVVRPGLMAASGDQISASERFTVHVDDRKPTVGFRGSTYVLPRIGSQGLPITTVNVERVELRLLRINDRNLIQQINGRRVSTTLDVYDIEAIVDRSGELVWEGGMAIQGERNQERTTAVPMGEVLLQPKAGIYVMTAEPADGQSAGGRDRATQWLVVSDLGLSTFKGSDGLHVFVRSLERALPQEGVQLRLYARNNGELGEAVTDAKGHAHFAPGLLRGAGGMEPAALMAYGIGGDFNFLDLTRPGFDLSDRGVEGRATPGPVDVYLYTERGVYRPGEHVELMALVRDDRGYGLEDLPLVLKLFRPDGVEADRLALLEKAMGGYYTRLSLADNARTGTWNVRAYLDPEGDPVGQITFQVEDFVPQRLALVLATEAAFAEPGKPIAIGVSGRFLYGAPAANLKAEAELVLGEDANPYPDYPDYRFGLVQESWKAKRFELAIAGTDASGKTATTLRLDEIPDTSRVLSALVRVSLFEPGGRPIQRVLSLPYRPQPFVIGIRPRFDEGVEIGEMASFDVVALDREGKPRAVGGLRYELLREDYDYYWYFRNNRWSYKLIIRDSEPVAGGSLKLTPEQPLTHTQNGLDWGRYRLEIHDPVTGIASSVRFQVGWFVGPGTEGSPDKLQLVLDRPSYAPGDVAQVHVKAPFAGEVLLTVAGNRLWTTRNFSVPAGGTTIELPVAESWGPGVYLTATAFRPAGEGAQRGPGRAIGVAWLVLDPRPRTLTLTIDAPQEVRPRQTLQVPISVEGVGPGEFAYLTLAAVDEGILQLTDFKSPDPLHHFLGKRRLGLDLLDVYGRLIESEGFPGQLRSGGDGESRQLDLANVRTVKTVALFSGPAPVDERGQVHVALDLPDFNGELRLMAVAWDRSRLGQAETALLVRDPLVAEAYLPRFLAPGDASRFTLELKSLSAAAGDYHVRLETGGAVALGAADTGLVFSVADSAVQQPLRKVYPLRGLSPGTGHVHLRIDGPQGFRLSREWAISVRSAHPLVTERRASRLAVGESLELGGDLLQGYVPGTSRLDLSFSTRPNLDVPGLLSQLNRYPYGCLEQTTSQAMPLLYFDQVAGSWLNGAGTKGGFHTRVQGAIQRILAMQRYGGGFGLWNPDSPAERWLSAYALDFLTRAKDEGYLVPDYPHRSGLGWLEENTNTTRFEPGELVAQSYALYVLAREQRARIGDLRYLHDNYLDKLPTRLAQAQLGAALARYGDGERAREAFAKAVEPLSRQGGLRDYGTALRDRAGVLALMAEADVMTYSIPALAEELAIDLRQRRYTSTQEQAWLLLAAQALSGEQAPLRLTVDDEPVPVDGKPFYLTPTPGALEEGVTISNRGEQPVWYVMAVSGAPVRPRPPAQAGFAISRRFYSRAGKEVTLDQVQQNDLLVAVISGEALTRESHQALVVDLLPAGVELENARLAHGQSTAELSWLPELSETLNVELRDDRFVTALDMNEVGAEQTRTFTLAYLLRVVTPGTYTLPAAFVEDMYKPWYFARGSTGKLEIQ